MASYCYIVIQNVIVKSYANSYVALTSVSTLYDPPDYPPIFLMAAHSLDSFFWFFPLASLIFPLFQSLSLLQSVNCLFSVLVVCHCCENVVKGVGSK